ncbi:MAG: flagellar hook-associated protein 3 [Calditrichaeota bacterium]|nr:MAG: flagellar hook-associated protein 3 [Calditrichota bacterium]
MRITNRMIARNLLASINSNRSLASKLQLDLTTTKKIRRPSDDPSGVVQIQKFKTQIGRNEQYQRNINQISGFLTSSAAAVDRATDLLERAKEIAIQGTSETIDAAARAAMAKDVDNLIDNMVELGNTTYNGRFVFAGTLTSGAAPFSRNGDQVTYNGNEGRIKGKIGAESELAYNKTGTEVFQPSGGVDLFDALITLKQALAADDTDTLQASIDTLDQGIKQTISVSAELGSVQDRLDLTQQTLENEKIRLADFLSRIQDTDVAGTIVNLRTAQNAITTGLRTMAETIQTSLVDFIG